MTPLTSASLRPTATTVRRQARLASLPLGALGLAAVGVLRRARGEDPVAVRRDLRTRNATRTRRTLGELRGGALKAGQLLSTVEALLPQDPEDTWREALTALQEGNRALPFPEVEPVLLAELGAGWRAGFDAFEEQAVAAASLGQVHRAVRDGRVVAVKVQYPGVREALTADLRAVSAVSRLASLVAPGLALPPLVAELRTRLTEELDYEHEARAQERFARAYDGDPDVVVPHVLQATPRVLVSEWLGGTPLAQVARSGDQARRDAAAARYQVFLVSGPERVGLLHTDPHPGNVRVLPDGRLGVLDFGSTLALPGMPETFGRLIAALLSDDPDLVLARLREGGFVRPGPLDVPALLDVMAPFTEPARAERFRFSRAWLRGQFARDNDPRDPDLAVAVRLTLPPEHLFTHRVWLSMVGVLCQLEAEVAVRPVLERWLPGFADATDRSGGAASAAG